MTHNLIKSLVALIMGAMLLAVTIGCEKEPAGQQGNEQQSHEQQPSDVPELANTSWLCSIENTYVQQGVTVNFSIDVTLDFIDEANGEYYEMASMKFPDHPSYNFDDDISCPFTYVVEGNSIFITDIWEDEETGETFRDTAEYIYNPDNQTISIDLNSPQLEQMTGTDKYVFTQVR